MTEHPEEERLEQYALGKLAGDELGQVEEHLLVCETCRDRLAELDADIRAIREVTGYLSEVPIRLIRETGSGPVHLEVTPAVGGGWTARLWGQEVDLTADFKTVQQANEYLLRSLADLFPKEGPPND